MNPERVIDARGKNLPGTEWSYKLSAGGQYAKDVLFSEAPKFDPNKMSLWIPFVDGKKKDGVGDLLEIGGIVTERHYKNPLVGFNHFKEVVLPIGIAREDPWDPTTYTVVLNQETQEGELNAFFYQGKGLEVPGLDRKHEYDHALYCEQLYDMAVKGVVRGGSIGYQVIDASPMQVDYRSGAPQGMHLKKVLMLEGSLVVLPANMDTVQKMLCVGRCCGKTLSSYLVKSLQPYTQKRKAQIGYEGKANAPPDVQRAEIQRESSESENANLYPKVYPHTLGIQREGAHHRNRVRQAQEADRKIPKDDTDPRDPLLREDALKSLRMRIRGKAVNKEVADESVDYGMGRRRRGLPLDVSRRAAGANVIASVVDDDITGGQDWGDQDFTDTHNHAIRNVKSQEKPDKADRLQQVMSERHGIQITRERAKEDTDRGVNSARAELRRMREERESGGKAYSDIRKRERQQLREVHGHGLVVDAMEAAEAHRDRVRVQREEQSGKRRGAERTQGDTEKNFKSQERRSPPIPGVIHNPPVTPPQRNPKEVKDEVNARARERRLKQEQQEDRIRSTLGKSHEEPKYVPGTEGPGSHPRRLPAEGEEVRDSSGRHGRVRGEVRDYGSEVYYSAEQIEPAHLAGTFGEPPIHPNQVTRIDPKTGVRTNKNKTLPIIIIGGKRLGDIPNYHKAENGSRSCATCSYFTKEGENSGDCQMYDATVGSFMVCSEWAGRKGTKAHRPLKVGDKVVVPEYHYGANRNRGRNGIVVRTPEREEDQGTEGVTVAHEGDVTFSTDHPNRIHLRPDDDPAKDKGLKSLRMRIRAKVYEEDYYGEEYDPGEHGPQLGRTESMDASGLSSSEERHIRRAAGKPQGPPHPQSSNPLPHRLHQADTQPAPHQGVSKLREPRRQVPKPRFLSPTSQGRHEAATEPPQQVDREAPTVKGGKKGLTRQKGKAHVSTDGQSEPFRSELAAQENANYTNRGSQIVARLETHIQDPQRLDRAEALEKEQDKRARTQERKQKREAQKPKQVRPLGSMGGNQTPPPAKTLKEDYTDTGTLRHPHNSTVRTQSGARARVAHHGREVGSQVWVQHLEGEDEGLVRLHHHEDVSPTHEVKALRRLYRKKSERGV